MSRLALHLFGTPRVELDGVPVAMRLRKATALLIYLALNRRPHGRDALATLLYPGFGQSDALGNLRRTLSTLNKAIDLFTKQLIAFTDEQLALHVENGDIFYDSFLDLHE